MSDHDATVRSLVLDAITQSAAHNGGWITRAELSALPLADGSIRRAIDQSRGIWNPRDLDATLTVMSSPSSSYGDSQVAQGLFRYSYRAGGRGGDNRKLIRAYELQVPIVLLLRLDEPGVYAPLLPCYVTEDSPDEQAVYIAVAPEGAPELLPAGSSQLERRWIERITMQRLHQAQFRGRVLRAYRSTCSICRLRHAELLDAAHIIEDKAEHGDAVVPNGLTLCKIHHAAYDQQFLGISPDYRVHIDLNLLKEKDGPMLHYGIQGMDGIELALPERKDQHPDRDRLKVRFERFTERQSV